MTTSGGAKKFQGPKGTRDFYPADLAVRRHIENVWRQVSINHGFDEIDGPTFEYLDLYTHKSGPGIANELFQVLSGKDEAQSAAIREGAAAPYALRPEFTPTLARMVAAKAGELPRPIKWFAIPSHFRAERPQRGRLREFMQWNVDFLGDDSPRADAEVIAVCVESLRRLGLTSNDVVVYVTDRELIEFIFDRLQLLGSKYDDFIDLLDRRSKLTHTEAAHGLGLIGLPADTFDRYDQIAADVDRELDRHYEEGDPDADVEQQIAHNMSTTLAEVGLARLRDLQHHLRNLGVDAWCKRDHTIVRGLAYYTSTVFEVHESSGAERAIAGGGRYDKLIESFGGPSLSACGFGMGDVVLANILRDKGLLKPAEEYLPQPDAFIIAADDDAAAAVPVIVARLRRAGLHVRQSYKTTRNVGKLLSDAAKCRARYAVIMDREFANGLVSVKNMQSGQQGDPVPIDQLEQLLMRSADSQYDS